MVVGNTNKERTTIRSFNVILSFSVRRDVPWHVSTSPPCSRARRTTESKLKRVHKIERGVLGKVYYALNIKKDPIVQKPKKRIYVTMVIMAHTTRCRCV